MTDGGSKKIPHVTADVMKEMDRRAAAEFGIPSLLLMENAGRGVAEFAAGQGARRITIVCGKGNNGGDGLVCARHLANKGFEVHILLAGPPGALKEDAALNLKIVQALGLTLDSFSTEGSLQKAAESLRQSDMIVDALLGIGLSSPVRSPLKEMIQQINESGKNVIAVDIPSGMHTDTGEALGIAIHAGTTLTLGLPKVGLFTPAGRLFAGEVRIIDIGLPFALTGIHL